MAQQFRASGVHVGAMERMRDELSRARKRGGRVVTPEQVASPMDLNPTLEVSAAIIRDCAYDVGHRNGTGAFNGIGTGTGTSTFNGTSAFDGTNTGDDSTANHPIGADDGFETDRRIATDRQVAADLHGMAGELNSTVDQKMWEAANGRPPAKPRRETA